MTPTKILLSAFDDKQYILSDGQQTLPYGNKNSVGQTPIGIDDSDDNAATVNPGPTDDDGLENWMPFFEDQQQLVLWDSVDFLDGVSEEFANPQNIDWDHPEYDDENSEDNFAVANS